MNRKHFAAIGAVVMVFAVLLAFAGCAKPAETVVVPSENGERELTAVPTVTVTGTGKLSLAPDMATVSIGAEVTRTNAEEAVNENAKLTDDIIKAIKNEGVADEDIQTANYSVYPNYSYDESTRRSVLDGYVVSNTVTVKVKDIDNVGKVLDSAVKAGANMTYGISFGLHDPDASRDELIRLAVEDAREQAELYTSLVGKKLGEAITVTTGSISDGVIYDMREYPVATESADAANAAKGVSINAGTLERTSSVTVRYIME